MPSSRPRLLQLPILTMSMLLLVAGTARAGDVDREVKAFFKTHCLDCHGPEKQKGKLRLDRLDPPSTSKRLAGKEQNQELLLQWDRVIERLESGEMPPEERDRPDPAELRRVVESLRELVEASAALAPPPPTVRRLNRIEYETTLHDLLSIDTELRDHLPEDGSAGGFDTVGAGLSLSPVHLEQYLHAARLALDATIQTGPEPGRVEKTFHYADERTIQKNPQLFRVLDEGVVFFDANYSPTTLKQFRAPAPGRYRFRVTARPFQTEELAVLRAYAGDLIPRDGKSRLVGHFDLPPGQDTVVEFITPLEEGHTILVAPHGTGQGLRKVGAKNYREPGLLVRKVEVEGPLHASWPPPGHRELLGNVDLGRGTIRDAARILDRLATRAFRRPVESSEILPFVKLVESRLRAGRDFESALRVGMTAVLCSPHFLLLVPRDHRGKPADSPGPLDDFTIASRLSYFLWSSLPDAELLELAGKKRLTRPENLEAQVERMLADPRARRFTKNFLGQWLELRDIDFTSPDPRLYPEFDELLQVSMVEETERFFEALLADDLSLLNLVDSDFTYLNERLAEHYDLQRVEKGRKTIQGVRLRRVELPPKSIRGGLLTQASILKVTANGTSTSPVMRGVWVNANILGSPLPPPPASVSAVEPDIRGTTTVRAQLEQHRRQPECQGCHRKIDPPGFALESFDVIGGERSFYRSLGQGKRLDIEVNHRRVAYRRGPAVDPSGRTPDGKRFRDIRDLKKLYLRDSETIARCVTEKLLTYALGREMHASDGTEIQRILTTARKKKYGLRSLLHAIVQSPLFLER